MSLHISAIEWQLFVLDLSKIIQPGQSQNDTVSNPPDELIYAFENI